MLPIHKHKCTEFAIYDKLSRHLLEFSVLLDMIILFLSLTNGESPGNMKTVFGVVACFFVG